MSSQHPDLPVAVTYRLLQEASAFAEQFSLPIGEAAMALLMHQMSTLEKAMGRVELAILQTARLTPAENLLRDDWLIYPIQVITAGTPVQGPGFGVPNGAEVTIRQRRHATDRVGYVSNTEGGVIDTLSRIELGNNDSFSVKSRGLDRFWFDSDTSGTYFELIVERKV